MATEPRRKKVRVNNIDINYWDWGGKGPAIVLLHPSKGFGRIWDFLARALQPEYRVICPDQRGHGDSDKPATGYAAEDYAADLDAFTRELGLKKIILGGQSLGGRVSMVFGAQHPDRASHLMLIGGPHFLSLFPDPGEAQFREARLREQAKAQVKFASAQAAMESMLVPTSFYRILSKKSLRHMIAHNMKHNPDGSVEWKWDRNATVQTLSHIPDDLKPYVKRLTCPILIPWAELSDDITPERVPIVKPLFPTARWVFMKAARYRMYMETPRSLAKVIRKFLGLTKSELVELEKSGVI